MEAVCAELERGADATRLVPLTKAVLERRDRTPTVEYERLVLSCARGIVRALSDAAGREAGSATEATSGMVADAELAVEQVAALGSLFENAAQSPRRGDGQPDGSEGGGGGGGGGAGAGGGAEGGVEPLPGETDAAYAARQARLRQEAAERMRAKFGGSGGLGGKLGGCGPSGASGVFAVPAAGSYAATGGGRGNGAGTASSGPTAPPPTSGGSGFVAPKVSHCSAIVGASGKSRKVAAAKVSAGDWDDFDDSW